MITVWVLVYFLHGDGEQTLGKFETKTECELIRAKTTHRNVLTCLGIDTIQNRHVLGLKTKNLS